MYGSKVKRPTFNEALTALKPIEIAGGSKSLFIVSNEGKVKLIINIIIFSIYFIRIENYNIGVCMWR